MNLNNENFHTGQQKQYITSMVFLKYIITIVTIHDMNKKCTLIRFPPVFITHI